VYGALRGALFRLDAERAHQMALAALRPVHRSPALQRLMGAPAPSPRLRMQAFGLTFPSPLGLAAGFDKGCEAYNALAALGFGHVEVGTVTPKPQPGNERPRMQRLPAHKAIVNRLGFPGPGAEACERRLRHLPPNGIVGANIGPNKTTAPEHVVDDLAGCTLRLAPLVRYLTVNVSSPNTPGLRALQRADAVVGLVAAVRQATEDMRAQRPVLLKLHPDVADDELVAVARAAVDAGAAGIVATNTTRSRPDGAGPTIDGGMSGAPLRKRALAAVSALHQGLGRDVPVVGVGGVFTGSDVVDFVRAGASLVQAYTGFVYRGPRMPALVDAEVEAELDRAGVDRLDELRGVPVAA